MAVVIETTIGDITVDLFIEERPRACLNFIKLCKLKYYNLNLFHTIERDFIAQTGDPTGVGDGGESVWGVVEGSEKRFFEAESLPKIKHTDPGLLSLVSVGKFMVGSQFFFTLGADLTSLDGIHCVIGEVVEGREVLRQLNEAIVDEKFRPYQDIRVTHTVILDDPFSDPRGFQVPSRSPSPTAERLQNGRIGADEDIDETEGKTLEEIQEMLAEREAKARATILEIVGDLPDADIAPPENVLFVCKLNPVTTDDDLEIIFSRFGKVKSCEVIRDKLSGDSLQYAFVEFEEQKSCEAAYFKMDNVLIDDRRIHVDFSQSVSKVQWRGKGRGVVHADERDRKLDFNNLKSEKRRDHRRPRDRSRSPVRKHDNGGRYPNQNRSPNGRRSPNNRRRSREPDNRRPREDRKENPSKERLQRKWSPSKERQRRTDDRRRSNDRRASPARQPRNTHGDGKRRSPDAERRTDERRRVPDARQRSPDRQGRNINRRRSPERRRSSVDEGHRSPKNRRPRSPKQAENSSQRSSSRRYSPDARRRSPEQERESRNREPQKDSRHDRNFDRREQPSKKQKAEPSRDEADRHPKKKSSVKDMKKKSKKRRKESSSSSSSSESETESSSTTTSSSSSEEERRKKVKKSKKKAEKVNKRPKKKSKRRDSSSSD